MNVNLSRVLRQTMPAKNGNGPTLYYRCYCGSGHSIGILPAGSLSPRYRWSWDGNADVPTFTPSINAFSSGIPTEGIPGWRCHHYVKDGKIEYLNDCTHEFAGVTLPMIDLSDMQPSEYY